MLDRALRARRRYVWQIAAVVIADVRQPVWGLLADAHRCCRWSWEADWARVIRPYARRGIQAVIVVGVDGSSPSLCALDWAAREASVRQCPLRIVHALVWPGPTGGPTVDPRHSGLRHAAERVLSAAADRARKAGPGLEITTALPAGVPAAALIDASHDAALLVVGHRGLGGFTGLLAGSVGIQAAARAACPVVVVRDGGLDLPGPAGQVVVGVDGSDLSSRAIDFAFRHAARHGLGVVAVHAYALPAVVAPTDAWLAGNDVAGWRGDHVRLLTDALVGYRDQYPDVPVRQRVVHGRPAEVLVAESARAAMTVVGSRGRGGLAGLLLGSTSQRVLHHATGPVAVVPVGGSGSVANQARGVSGQASGAK
jgi:nucleotide-binding universal stress UspA family protein